MKQLIVVYGSLRKFGHNHRLIENSEYLGEFNSPPIYSLYSLGSFPGLKEGGETSVVFEVYSVDETTAKQVDRLEGYTEGGNNTFYDKIKIDTPFGEASVYTYQGSVRESDLVKSGDWKSYFENKRLSSIW